MPHEPVNNWYRARWVLPMAGPPISGGVVEVSGSRIARVGLPRAGDSAAEDLGDVVLLPTLVNAHTHLEFSRLSAPLGTAGMPFTEWIRAVIAWRRSQVDDGDPRAAGLRESIIAGVGLVGEIDTRGTPLPASPVAAVVFRELIGLKATLLDERRSLAAAFVEAFPESASSTAGISPHAPYTVHPRLLDALISLACRHRVPLAFHLAESPEELQLLAQGDGPLRCLLEEVDAWQADAIAPGSRPIDYLRQLARAPRSLVVHGNYLEDDELAFVADHADRMAVVYCPRTHAYFGHPPHPLPRLLARGAQVVVGTDSRASNPDLSVLDELRHVARRFPAIPAATVLELGTLRAAAALGRPELGKLAAGGPANMAAVPIDSRYRDPHEAVLASLAPVVAVWLGGQPQTLD